MQITCLCCGARQPLDAALADEAARRAFERLAALGGELPALAIVYLGGFRPRGRVLAWSRAVRLLDALHALVDASTVRRRGRGWTVTRAQWAQALGIVAERLADGRIERPLKNHAYLTEVAVGLADRAEGEAERALEERRRQRAATDEGAAERMSPEDAAESARLRDAVMASFRRAHADRRDQ